MRNSALPIISVVVIVGLLVIRMQSLPTAEAGSAGPELATGIFRLAKQERFRLPSGAVASENVITASAAEGADGQGAARFRVVVVAAEDHEALTAALVLALAERLTESGSIVIIDTLHDRPLQLPADRVLCVSTRASTLPAVPGGACSAELVVVDRLLAFPAHAAAALAQGAIAEPISVRFAISHHSHGTADQGMKWGSWYAAVGRTMAVDLFTRIVPSGVPVMRDPAGKPRADLPERPDWGTAIPAPPFIEPVRWFGAVQDDFVRGWLGELALLESTDEHGERLPTIERLETALRSARVVKEAAWTLDEHSSAAMKMWNRDQDCLVALKRADGWDLMLWQQRPGIVAIYRHWLEEAATGSVPARRSLARYETCTIIPADERAHALAIIGPGSPAGSPASALAPGAP